MRENYGRNKEFNRIRKIMLIAILVSIVFVGGLYLNNDIGIPRSKVKSDVLLTRKIQDDWMTEGVVSDTMAAYISYAGDKADYTFSVYVNRPGLSFG